MENNKIKLLFVTNNFHIGGIQRSLTELLKVIDYNKYEVSVSALEIEGELRNEIDVEVDFVELPLEVKRPFFNKKSLFTDFLYAITNPKYFTSFLKTLLFTKPKSSKYFKEKYWEYSKQKIPGDINSYDIVINYAGGVNLLNEYVIDKINAPFKLCWFHGDYNNFGTKTEHEINYYNKFNKIIFVTEISRNIMIEKTGFKKSKTNVIENIINKKRILTKSKEDVSINQNGLLFVSVSRLVSGKGLECGIEAFEEFIRLGFQATWIILGDGPDFKKLQNKIIEKDLSKNIYLMGFVSNPYPYLNKADVFFHCSTSEGKSFAVEEAKLLGKPILITKYATIHDQVKNNYNALIVEANFSSILKGLVRLANDKEFRDSISNRPYNFKTDTIKKFDQMITKLLKD